MASRILWFGVLLGAAVLAVDCKESPSPSAGRMDVPPHVRLSASSLTAIAAGRRHFRGGTSPEALESAGALLLTKGLWREAVLNLESASLLVSSFLPSS
jgi:hypothetical protein